MKETFIKGIERLVNPVDVGSIHFIQYFTHLAPKSIQQKMVAKSAKDIPNMGFVVEPYSYYLFYELKDLDKAKTFLPKGFKLAKTKVFEGDEPKYFAIFGCFNAHTSSFWGMRLEFYMIAEDESTGLLSWIIADYDTNTISYDPKHGLSDPNAVGSMITVDYDGILHCDVQSSSGRKLIYSSDVTKGQMLPLDKKLWVEGNLSIAYGALKSEDDPGKFSLTFEQNEFKQGLKMPKEAFDLKVNNWYPGLFEEEPYQLLCFPYAQHLLSDSPGHSTGIPSVQGLEKAVEATDFSQIKVFSTEPFKKSILRNGMVSTAINTALLILLVLTRRALKRSRRS
jgi:hypothetical protein